MNFHADDVKAQEFLRTAGLDVNCDFEVRRIGTDDAMVDAIIERIASGEKTMTYSLPWIAERTGRSPPQVGRHIVVIDASGEPSLVLRLTEVRMLNFGAVNEHDIRHEGIPMRTLSAWRPLHIAVWNEKLAPLGLRVSDDMPVWAEEFELAYNAG